MKSVAVVGAQYGSEGKGALIASIANQFKVHIRTGGPNAGHTIHHEGKEWKMQSVPCGWINPEAQLIIGAGALIDVENLIHEVDAIEAAGYEVRSRLWVDEKAGIIDPMRHSEGGVAGYAHEIIGSTGKGVGRARLARVARRTMNPMSGAWVHFHQAAEDPDLEKNHIQLEDCATTLNSARYEFDDKLLEGTQGSGLSLIHGEWPYVTSTDTNTAQLYADCGLSIMNHTETILVARAHPIRVAGTSGPLPNETTWEELGIEPEFTTVTKKVRRVAEWDDRVVKKAIAMNAPCVMAFMFLDYLFPECAGAIEWSAISKRAREFLYTTSARLGADIQYIGTGPDTVVDMFVL